MKAINWPALIGFKLSWFALVLFQNLLVIPVLLFVLWSLWRCSQSERLIWLALAAVGISLDSVLQYSGVLSFSGATWLPLWMLVLWLVFSLVVVQVFSVYLQKYWLAALIAAVSGPMAYLGGAALSGQMQVSQTTEAYIVLALCWACFGVLSGWSRKFYA
ncbi:MAG: DUF2878 domain-containing protein [Gammaproteobacteria bacterium]|nr:DUF2878 domain-containing protein [Gammaproteobacteria bacterium]MBU2058137.1 DUF2878 domain-containing protein [Gammaproteobacteria bacterium]MBU2176044.1 DUF2878 domain-containing protein [Gammaproteobacteria bacterium]MBU2247231.1 DUF2878 domain-containing protein [Gammaproteobacteria bacterium]MBU2342673.1 DUF2878 domain-containing protein [Gammaproteobacteria bacterium]